LNDEFNWIVGVNIRHFREERDVLQKDLAKAAGMDQSVLNRVEAGERSLKLREALCIAKHLRISVEKMRREHDHIDYD
jgi:transcriptional regulator with XRE-family HTH domain